MTDKALIENEIYGLVSSFRQVNQYAANTKGCDSRADPEKKDAGQTLRKTFLHERVDIKGDDRHGNRGPPIHILAKAHLPVPLMSHERQHATDHHGVNPPMNHIELMTSQSRRREVEKHSKTWHDRDDPKAGYQECGPAVKGHQEQ